MKRVALILLILTFIACGGKPRGPRGTGTTNFRPSGSGSGFDTNQTLAEARQTFQPQPFDVARRGNNPPNPPAHLFQKVLYTTSKGDFPAYVSTPPKDGQRRPAIIWITGGDCNSIDEGCWTEGAEANDQSAAAYRQAGIIMMFPSLRGGNANPGPKEGFLGEVEDVVDAYRYLSKQPFVDPDRIYLGGHSTGGTLALLVAEYTNVFRAVFSFGPVEDVAGYGKEFNPFNIRDTQEVRMRSPIHWLHGITKPTFVIEGADDGNDDSLKALQRRSTNSKVQFYLVGDRSHFSVLKPANRVIAKKILADRGASCNITLNEKELQGK